MSGLFGKRPDPQPPAPMPDTNSPAVLEAGRRSTAAAMARAGRTSTILQSTTGNSRSGGDTYSASKLGN